MREESRLSSHDTLQPLRRPGPTPPVPLALPHDPSHKSFVQRPEHSVERRPVERPVVEDPSPQNRVEHVRQVRQILVRSAGHSPVPSHLLPHLLLRFLADCRTEAAEIAAVAIPRPTRPERESQKVEALMGIASRPVGVLAVYDLRLLWMDFQPAPPKPSHHRLPEFLGWRLGSAVHDKVSPAGVSPPGARRTVLERLRSYGSHHPAAGFRPRSCQWANIWGSRRPSCPSQCSARHRCLRSLLYFLMAQRTRRPLRCRKTGYRADGKNRPKYWIQPRRTGFHMRARSSMALSLRSGSRQRLISWRIFLAAVLLAAGLKFTKYFPQRFFDRRGRNVYPKKSNFSRRQQNPWVNLGSGRRPSS